MYINKIQLGFGTQSALKGSVDSKLEWQYIIRARDNCYKKYRAGYKRKKVLDNKPFIAVSELASDTIYKLWKFVENLHRDTKLTLSLKDAENRLYFVNSHLEEELNFADPIENIQKNVKSSVEKPVKELKEITDEPVTLYVKTPELVDSVGVRDLSEKDLYEFKTFTDTLTQKYSPKDINVMFLDKKLQDLKNIAINKENDRNVQERFDGDLYRTMLYFYECPELISRKEFYQKLDNLTRIHSNPDCYPCRTRMSINKYKQYFEDWHKELQ